MRSFDSPSYNENQINHDSYHKTVQEHVNMLKNNKIDEIRKRMLDILEKSNRDVLTSSCVEIHKIPSLYDETIQFSKEDLNTSNPRDVNDELGVQIDVCLGVYDTGNDVSLSDEEAKSKGITIVNYDEDKLAAFESVSAKDCCIKQISCKKTK
ncbi:uncharacterized protein LOC128883441 [Hylaeus volcanicus]|uniref:uncharacterized protein LOC128883441 n=1 Tax=Hylaeus volcanicus TaxID=313075 RepID=UPI0023B88007|nr:uncharacterized protein LOC128883441 [Hylaeus volcanicus]